MLSKAPKRDMEESKDNSLSEEELMDQEIATAVLTDTFLGGEGEQGIAKALNSPEPAKALAIQIFAVIEATQTESMDTDVPISPRVWLAQGGAVDDFMDDLAEFAERFGVEDDMIEELAPAVKQELVNMFQARGSDLEAQAQQRQAGPPTGAPVPQRMMGGA